MLKILSSNLRKKRLRAPLDSCLQNNTNVPSLSDIAAGAYVPRGIVTHNENNNDVTELVDSKELDETSEISLENLEVDPLKGDIKDIVEAEMRNIKSPGTRIYKRFQVNSPMIDISLDPVSLSGYQEKDFLFTSESSMQVNRVNVEIYDTRITNNDPLKIYIAFQNKELAEKWRAQFIKANFSMIEGGCLSCVFNNYSIFEKALRILTTENVISDKLSKKLLSDVYRYLTLYRPPKLILKQKHPKMRIHRLGMPSTLLDAAASVSTVDSDYDHDYITFLHSLILKHITDKKLDIKSHLDMNYPVKYSLEQSLLFLKEINATSLISAVNQLLNGNFSQQSSAMKNLELFEYGKNPKEDSIVYFIRGICYFYGFIMPQDKKLALELYTTAERLGSVQAIHELAYCYSNGNFLEKTPKLALEYLNKAAKQGFAPSIYNLGLYYCDDFSEVNPDPDYKKGLEMISIAASKGYAIAQQRFGTIVSCGHYGMEKNAQRAFELYQTAATSGLSQAQYDVGLCFYNGEGVEKNPQNALKWFTHSALQNFAPAQYKLALCFIEGFGPDSPIFKDHRIGHELLELAVLNNYPEAKFTLACILNEGIFIPRNRKRAFELLNEAANQGLAKALYELGECYRLGGNTYITDKNPRKAIELLNKAAHQDFPDAFCALGLCYLEGFGVARDPNKANEYFLKAVQLNSEAGHYNLGCSYNNGVGAFKIDLEKALKHYRIASDNGYIPATMSMAKIFEEGTYGCSKSILTAFKYYKKAAASGNDLAVTKVSQLGKIEFVQRRVLHFFREFQNNYISDNLCNLVVDYIGLEDEESQAQVQKTIVNLKQTHSVSDSGDANGLPSLWGSMGLF